MIPILLLRVFFMMDSYRISYLFHTSGNLVQLSDFKAFDGLGIFFFFREGSGGIIPGGGGGPPVQQVNNYIMHCCLVLIDYLEQVEEEVDLELLVGVGLEEVGVGLEEVGVGLEEVEVQQLEEEQQLPPRFHPI